MIRTRFAPSPTGFVHIGNIRTALFGYLFAKHNKGNFILRIEDTDRARLVEGAVENLLKVMKHLGITPDEGFYLDENNTVGEKGEFGPYLQSQRLSLYQKHALELIEKNKAYYCYCSEQRLDDLRKEQVALKKPPMYDMHCRNLNSEQRETEAKQCRAEGRNPVVRFAMPQEGRTEVNDLIYGKMSYENKLLDDQVILKSDGFPTYHLAVVVDDHYMKISHVTRTEEWLPSTPKHVLLYQAFNWEPPIFAHMPLLLNPDKSKLSKRQGDVAVEDFLAKGYLKEALINFVAFLGWNPKTTQEIFSLEDLIVQFDLQNVNKSGAIFDINKLDWMNGQYIKNKPVGELVNLALPYWEQVGVNVENFSREFLHAILNLEKERIKKLSEIGERTKYFFQLPEYDSKLLIWKKSDATKTKQALTDLYELFSQMQNEDFTQSKLDIAIKKLIADKNYDNGSVFWPLRAALTGLSASPNPLEITETLHTGYGKDEILRRLKTGIDKL